MWLSCSMIDNKYTSIEMRQQNENIAVLRVKLKAGQITHFRQLFGNGMYQVSFSWMANMMGVSKEKLKHIINHPMKIPRKHWNKLEAIFGVDDDTFLDLATAQNKRYKEAFWKRLKAEYRRSDKLRTIVDEELAKKGF